MKIRIRGNSVRYRLSKTDIAQFGKNGYLEESTRFPGNAVFRYQLERSKTADTLQAGFTGTGITVYVPEKIAEEWVQTERVGFDQLLPLENGTELYLLIEKDFACLDHTTEDQSDNYPNPNRACGREKDKP